MRCSSITFNRMSPGRGRRGRSLELAEQLDDTGASFVVPAEVLLEAPGLGEVAERRVRDEPVHATADERPRLAVDLGPLHRPLLVLGFDVTGERVDRLVVVVVGVETA